MPVEDIRKLRPTHQYLVKDSGGNNALDINGSVQNVTEDFDDNDVVDPRHITPTNLIEFSNLSDRNSSVSVSWLKGDFSMVEGGETNRSESGTFVYTGDDQETPTVTTDSDWKVLGGHFQIRLDSPSTDEITERKIFLRFDDNAGYPGRTEGDWVASAIGYSDLTESPAVFKSIFMTNVDRNSENLIEWKTGDQVILTDDTLDSSDELLFSKGAYVYTGDNIFTLSDANGVFDPTLGVTVDSDWQFIGINTLAESSVQSVQVNSDSEVLMGTDILLGLTNGIEVMTTDPAGAGLTEGLVWYNSVDDVLRFYNGTDVDTISVGASTFGGNFNDLLGLPGEIPTDSNAQYILQVTDASGVETHSWVIAPNDVSLVTTEHDYLTLSDQEITLGTIDISDDTNLVDGTGITLTGDTLSVDYGTDEGTAAQGNDTRLSDSRTCDNTFDDLLLLD